MFFTRASLLLKPCYANLQPYDHRFFLSIALLDSLLHYELWVLVPGVFSTTSNYHTQSPFPLL